MASSISPSAGPSGSDRVATPPATARNVARKTPCGAPAGNDPETRNQPILLTFPFELAVARYVESVGVGGSPVKPAPVGSVAASTSTSRRRDASKTRLACAVMIALEGLPWTRTVRVAPTATLAELGMAVSVLPVASAGEATARRLAAPRGRTEAARKRILSPRDLPIRSTTSSLLGNASSGTPISPGAGWKGS